MAVLATEDRWQNAWLSFLFSMKFAVRVCLIVLPGGTVWTTYNCACAVGLTRVSLYRGGAGDPHLAEQTTKTTHKSSKQHITNDNQ